MKVGEWRTAELELPTGLEGDGLAVLLGADDVAGLHDGLPVEAIDERLEELLDVRLVFDGLQGIELKAEFLVFGADSARGTGGVAC